MTLLSTYNREQYEWTMHIYHDSLTSSNSWCLQNAPFCLSHIDNFYLGRTAYSPVISPQCDRLDEHRNCKLSLHFIDFALWHFKLRVQLASWDADFVIEIKIIADKTAFLCVSLIAVSDVT